MLSIREWERRCDQSAARSHARRGEEQRHEALLLLATAVLILVALLMYT